MKIINHKNLLIPASLMAILLTASTAANAIPAFARKYKTNCSSCHTAYPKLNATGRHFKEAGYSLGGEKDAVGEEKISDYLNWDKYVPLSGAIVLRPYDRESPGSSQIHALHEVEIISGGRAYKNVSSWFELEAEDDEDSFNVTLGSGFLTYSHNSAVNVQAGYGQFLFADPYDTYSDMRRLTASHNPITNRRYLGADNGGRFRDARQQISLFGRTLNDKLFYIVGGGGLASDTVADKSRAYYARLAFDVTPNIMIGGMAMDGSCEVGTEPNNPDNGSQCGDRTGDPLTQDQDFSRYAIDTQIDIDNFRLVGVYQTNNEDIRNSTKDETNDTWYVEGTYVLRDDGRPTWVPQIRLDQYEENDGKDSFSTATLNLGYYFTQNIKGFIEYSNLYDVPTGESEGSRSTVQLEAAF